MMATLWTQAVGLGFIKSPLRGSRAHTSRLSPTGFWSVASAPPTDVQGTATG